MDGTERKPWTERETTLAYRLYCELPFGQMDHRNRKVISLAAALGRTPGSIAMRLGNFASLDPSMKARGIRGMSNASRLDREVAAKFAADSVDVIVETSDDWQRLFPEQLDADEGSALPTGPSEAVASVKVRLTQGFFRRAVVASYEAKCCLCGLSNERLLVASHIIPWAVAPEQRANPRNGLCLCALHDRAFDRGLVALGPDLGIIVSPEALCDAPAPVERTAFHDLVGSQAAAPVRFGAAPAFLAYHREHIFRH